MVACDRSARCLPVDRDSLLEGHATASAGIAMSSQFMHLVPHERPPNPSVMARSSSSGESS